MVLLAPTRRQVLVRSAGEDPIEQLRRMQRWHEQGDDFDQPPPLPRRAMGAGAGEVTAVVVAAPAEEVAASRGRAIRTSPVAAPWP